MLDLLRRLIQKDIKTISHGKQDHDPIVSSTKVLLYAISYEHIGKTENTQTGWEYNTFKKKQICDFLQLDEITKNLYSYYTKFFFSILIFLRWSITPRTH